MMDRRSDLAANATRGIDSAKPLLHMIMDQCPEYLE